MRKHITTLAAVSAAALLAACAAPQQPIAQSYPSGPYPVAASSSTYPSTTTYPSATQVQTAPAAIEMGRVADIQTVAMGQTSATDHSTRNAVVGGIIGAVVGNAIGKDINNGGNRAGTTVLGGAAGAAIGNRVGQNQAANTASAGAAGPAYRVTVQTDAGAMRTYEVGALGDLRVGDRVRVENNVIYRAS
jgi:outer membrane lipoprotein SlyB